MTKTSQDHAWNQELEEWRESLAAVEQAHGAERVRELLAALKTTAEASGVATAPDTLETPYKNTIAATDQPAYPGDEQLEERIENIVRWNAMAMVLRANDSGSGVGGHIATYASAATMLEVGFNHFFRGREAPSDGNPLGYGGDLVNIQAHASPGVYARAFLEGRLSEVQLHNFRRELQDGGGLCSYPHPRRMPGFWQAPTASMGLSTVSSIYQARFSRYLENRGLKPKNGGHVWNFIGDGEADEPEVMGTIAIAAREQLDNLTLCVNCNLQRLDGPVRGNGKIIQELEGIFRGAGWHVIKVIWGSEWDSLIARDVNGVLQHRMEEVVDGDYQRYSTLSGKEVREHWLRTSSPADRKELEEIMNSLSDEAIRTIKRGGHDRRKVYAAYEEAVRIKGKPTVILFKTIKGYGLGERAEGQNTAHQKKKMNDAERTECARAFGIPLAAQEIERADLYSPPEESREVVYLKSRRDALGGYLPRRSVDGPSLKTPNLDTFQLLVDGSGDRQISTTMAMVRLLAKLLRDDEVGKYVVPIVPDEARTFGMDGLFRQAGIYSHVGQRYTPVDANTVLPYREAKDGQILQEGICEAGALASFISAGTAYANFGVPTIPFYVFYSIFGFQRVGDLIWAAADQLCKGFLLGGTAGRTTLNGEGLQHQDGHSHLVAQTVPSLMSYDPAFGYEVAVIVREGIRRMYEEDENLFYYLTLYNENYTMPSMEQALGNVHLLDDREDLWAPARSAASAARMLREVAGDPIASAGAADDEQVGDGVAASTPSGTAVDEDADASSLEQPLSEPPSPAQPTPAQPTPAQPTLKRSTAPTRATSKARNPEPLPPLETLATVEEGILRGMYLFKRSELPVRRSVGQVQLLGSGSLLQQALRAQQLLADFEVAADVWSVTSYGRLHRNAAEMERWRRLNPAGDQLPSYLETILSGVEGPFVAVSDYQRLVPDSIARWFPGRFISLGTDGFGLSESRDDLRSWFEVSGEHVAFAALGALCEEGKIMAKRVRDAGNGWGVRARQE